MRFRAQFKRPDSLKCHTKRPINSFKLSGTVEKKK